MIKRLLQKQKTQFKSKQLRRNFILIAGNEFFSELQLFYPITVLAFQAVTGSFTLAMSVIGLIGISKSFFEIPTGILSDKIGRRKTLIIGCFAEVIGTLFYTLSFSTFGGIYILFAGALFFGFAQALFSGNNYAMLYETLSFYKQQNEISGLIGRIRSMGQIALSLSGILAGLCLWAGFSYQDLMLFSLVPICISFILSLFTVEPARHLIREKHSYQHMITALKLVAKNPSLRWLALASALKDGLGQSSNSFSPGFVETVWPLWITPFFRTGQNGMSAIAFWFSGFFVKRFGALKILITGSFFSTIIRFIAYTFVSAFSPLLMITSAFSYAIMHTADHTLQQRNFSGSERSTMGSIISFGGGIIWGISSVLLGFMADTLSPALALLILTLCYAPINIIYFSLYKKK